MNKEKTAYNMCPKLLLMVLIFISSITMSFADSSKLVVLTEEWAPYNYTENGRLTGFSVEVVRHIAARLGQDIDFRVYPSMRASRLLETMPNAMFVSMFRTLEREDQFQWVGPLIDASIYFYKRKGSNHDVKSIEDARNVGIVASRHSGLVHRLLKENGFENLDDSAKDGWEVYKKLLAGRVDLGISDTPLGVQHILRNLGAPIDALEKTSLKILDLRLFIAVNKDVPEEIVRQWQQTLDEIKKSGVYDKVLSDFRS